MIRDEKVVYFEPYSKAIKNEKFHVKIEGHIKIDFLMKFKGFLLRVKIIRNAFYKRMKVSMSKPKIN